MVTAGGAVVRVEVARVVVGVGTLVGGTEVEDAPRMPNHSRSCWPLMGTLWVTPEP